MVRFTATSLFGVVPSCWVHADGLKTWWPKNEGNAKRYLSSRHTTLHMSKSYDEYDIEVVVLAGKFSIDNMLLLFCHAMN